MRLALALPALVLAGCASSGPVSTGKDTYIITKQSSGGIFVTGGTVKTDLLVEANAFCGASGMKMHLIDSNAKNAIPFARMSSAEIHFRRAKE